MSFPDKITFSYITVFMGVFCFVFPYNFAAVMTILHIAPVIPYFMRKC